MHQVVRAHEPSFHKAGDRDVGEQVAVDVHDLHAHFRAEGGNRSSRKAAGHRSGSRVLPRIRKLRYHDVLKGEVGRDQPDGISAQLGGKGTFVVQKVVPVADVAQGVHFQFRGIAELIGQVLHERVYVAVVPIEGGLPYARLERAAQGLGLGSD